VVLPVTCGVGPVEPDEVGGPVQGTEPEPSGDLFDPACLVQDAHGGVRGQGGGFGPGIGGEADTAQQVGQGYAGAGLQLLVGRRLAGDGERSVRNVLQFAVPSR
jgi:hypothetical protein